MKGIYVAPLNSIHSQKWLNELSDIYVEWLSLYKTDGASNAFKFFIDAMCLIGYSFFKVNRRDFIHCQSLGWHSICGWLLSKLLNLPCIVTCWGSDVVFLNNSSLVKRWLKIRILNDPEVLFTVDAKHMAERLCNIGVDEVRVFTIRFGIEEVGFRKVRRRVDEIKQGLSLVSVRNLENIYDVELIANATASLVSQGIPVSLTIAGDGSLASNLQEQFKSCDFITFSGRYDRAKLAELILSHDVMISASWSDAGLSASIGEFMLAGVPVLASKSGENEDWLSDEYLFECGNIEELKRAILFVWRQLMVEESCIERSNIQSIEALNLIGPQMLRFREMVENQLCA